MSWGELRVGVLVLLGFVVSLVSGVGVVPARGAVVALARQTEVRDPLVVADAARGAVVVWSRGPYADEGRPLGIYAALRSDQGRFEAVQRLSAVDGGDPEVAMAPDGEATVVWEHQVCSDGTDHCTQVMAAPRAAAIERDDPHTVLRAAQAVRWHSVPAARQYIEHVTSLLAGAGTQNSFVFRADLLVVLWGVVGRVRCAWGEPFSCLGVDMRSHDGGDGGSGRRGGSAGGGESVPRQDSPHTC